MDPQTLEALVLGASIAFQAGYIVFHSRRGVLAIAGLMVALIVGLLAQSVTGGIVNNALKVYFPGDSYTYTLGPVMEESAKLGLLLVVLIPLGRLAMKSTESNLSFSTSQMGMATGVFFMLFERFLKDFPGGFSFPGSILDEAPVHAVATGIAASGLKGTSAKRLLYTFPLAILVHAMWNLSAYLSIATNSVVLVQGAGFILFWTIFMVLGKRFRPPTKEVSPTSLPSS